MDEVAAQHIDANALVHYGHACMSQCVHLTILFDNSYSSFTRTYRLPVIYVFGKKPIDVEDCVVRTVETFSSHSSSAASLESNRCKKIVLRHDVAYTHQAGTTPIPMVLFCLNCLNRETGRSVSGGPDAFRQPTRLRRNT